MVGTTEERLISLPRILITGAGGQLGADCALLYGAAGADVTAATRSDLDIGDRDAVLSMVDGVKPDVVINAGAWTAVDDCEADPDRAFRVNGLAVRHLNEACTKNDAHLVHLSTDYVFDGNKPEPYVEWDDTHPQSVYGHSKLAGECEMLPNFTVIRTSWVCGEHGHNMVKTILGALEKYPTLSFVDDQIGHPTFTADLATMVQRLGDERRPGTFHVTNQGAVSWFGFTQAVLEAVGEDPARVEPISTDELQPPRPAPRPANSVLDNAALRLSGIELLRDFREPLAELVAKLR